MGGTWGISGPTFLVGYLLLAAVTWVATARRRRALADGPDRPAPPHPHDLAFLNGGAELALTSALTTMHLTGTVAPRRGEVLAVGRLTAGADALERAVHHAAAAPVARRRLLLARPVRTALDAIEVRLVSGGLLLSEDRRRAVRAVGRWTAAVAGLGLLRLLAGLADGRPVGFLVVALVGVAALALVQLLHAPRRTRAGDRLLARLRDENTAISPGMRPDWVAHGPAAAAMGVGLFGASALWASDPALAEELELQRAAAAGGGTAPVGSYGGGDSGAGARGGGGGGCGGGGGGGCGG